MHFGCNMSYNKGMDKLYMAEVMKLVRKSVEEQLVP